jgi:2'-5' RNA ligase
MNWFIAFPVPPGSGWQSCGETLPEDLRRFAPEDLHLSVAFLGACGERRALDAWDAITGLRLTPLTAWARGWQAMGAPRRPSAYAICVDLAPEPCQDLLQSWRDAALRAADLPADPRPLRPHVTLARPPRRCGDVLRERMAAWLETAPRPDRPLLLNRIALYTWENDRRSRLFRFAAERTLEGASSPPP